MSYSIRNQFMQMPIEVFNKEVAKTIGEENAPSAKSYVMLDPEQITEYRPTSLYGIESDEMNCTHVGLKNGDYYVVLWRIGEFEWNVEHFMNTFYKKEM